MTLNLYNDVPSDREFNADQPCVLCNHCRWNSGETAGHCHVNQQEQLVDSPEYVKNGNKEHGSGKNVQEQNKMPQTVKFAAF